MKAHAGRGSDMERLKEIGRHVRKGRLQVSASLVREAVEFFGDEAPVLLRRLREAGLL